MSSLEWTLGTELGSLRRVHFITFSPASHFISQYVSFGEAQLWVRHCEKVLEMMGLDPCLVTSQLREAVRCLHVCPSFPETEKEELMALLCSGLLQGSTEVVCVMNLHWCPSPSELQASVVGSSNSVLFQEIQWEIGLQNDRSSSICYNPLFSFML